MTKLLQMPFSLVSTLSTLQIKYRMRTTPDRATRAGLAEHRLGLHFWAGLRHHEHGRMSTVPVCAESGPRAREGGRIRVVQCDTWILSSSYENDQSPLRFRVGPKVVGLAHDAGKRFEYIGRMFRFPGYCKL